MKVDNRGPEALGVEIEFNAAGQHAKAFFACIHMPGKPVSIVPISMTR